MISLALPITSPLGDRKKMVERLKNNLIWRGKNNMIWDALGLNEELFFYSEGDDNSE
jgi:hypothetical protein